MRTEDPNWGKNVKRYAKRARSKLGSMQDQLKPAGAGIEGAGTPDADERTAADGGQGAHGDPGAHGGPETHAAPGAHDNGHGMVSVREAMHRGKHIVVKTTYEITIDGEPLAEHVGVANDGSVHYHGLPNYAFRSMIDLVRKVIDASGVELPADEIGAGKDR